MVYDDKFCYAKWPRTSACRRFVSASQALLLMSWKKVSL